MMLADAAQAVDGKLYILGGGWSICGPDATPMAVAVKIEVPWDQANLQHTSRLVLLDSDGAPVMVETTGGTAGIEISTQFEVGRPPGHRPGTPIDFAFAVNTPPLALDPGGRYVWKFEIDGESRDDWRLAFSTRPAIPPSQPLR